MRPPRQRAKHEACGAMFRNPHPTPSEPHGKCSRVNSQLAYRTDSRKTSAVLPTREPGSRSGSSPIATPESPFHLEILQPCEKEELFSDLKSREQIPILPAMPNPEGRELFVLCYVCLCPRHPALLGSSSAEQD